MRQRGRLSLIISFVILLQIFISYIPVHALSDADWSRYSQELPPGTPRYSENGYEFNPLYWEKDGLMVYGSPGNVKPNDRDDKGRFRYLGYDKDGAPFTNEEFTPDRITGETLEEKKWIFEPWKDSRVLSLPSAPSRDGNNWSTQDIYWNKDSRYKDNLATALEGLGWKPYGSMDFYGYFYIQSYPTLEKTGSMRGWHPDPRDGAILYQTFTIPKLERRMYETPFNVTTEILTSDFTIDETESSTELKIRVTAKLEDESVYSDPDKRVCYYTRDDVEGFWIKLEYKGLAPYVWIKGNGSNTASNTFKVTLSRGQVTDGERVTFNGIGRVKFKDSKEDVDNDIEEAVITVENTNMDLPPGLYINAPAKANVAEDFVVEVIPIIPEGESIKSLSLQGSFNGGAFQNIPLSNKKATVSYPEEGMVNFKANVSISNGKDSEATAATQIVDERSADAKADVMVWNKEAYEGHPVEASNWNKFYFDGKSYSARQADELGLGRSRFYIYDNSQYELDRELYERISWEVNDEITVAFKEPGEYKIGLKAIPTRGEEDEDVEAVTILPCPDIKYTLLGSKKHNRKLTLDFSRTVTHPEYPLKDSKTYVDIKDTSTGERVRVTNSEHPDSEHIKTLAMSGNAFDFLIKAPEQKELEITIYVEDTRGYSDTESFKAIIKPDLPPVAEITASLVQYRDREGKAQVRIGKSGKSPDGDRLIVNHLKYSVDTDNDGSFTDEALKNLSSSLDELEAIINTDRVGKILLDYTIKEDLTPSTIPKFVSDSDYLSHHVTKVIDVDNLEPHTALRVISSLDMDLLLIGDESRQSTIMTKADSLKVFLNSLETPVSLTNTVKSANLSDKEAKLINEQSTGYFAYRVAGRTNNCYAYTVRENSNDHGYDYNDLFIREFETGELKMHFPNTTKNVTVVGDWMIITDNNSNPKYVYYNTVTGELFRHSAYINRTNYSHLNILYIEQRGDMTIFDGITGNFSTFIDIGKHNFIKREGSRLYYIEASSHNTGTYGTIPKYVLKYADLNTEQVHVEDTFISPYAPSNPNNICGMYSFRGYRLLDETHMLFYDTITYIDRDDANKIKYFNIITLFNLETKKFSHFTSFELPRETIHTSPTGRQTVCPLREIEDAGYAVDFNTNILYAHIGIIYTAESNTIQAEDWIFKVSKNNTILRRKKTYEQYDSRKSYRYNSKYGRDVVIYQDILVNYKSGSGLRVFNLNLDTMTEKILPSEYKSSGKGSSALDIALDYKNGTLDDYYYITGSNSRYYRLKHSSSSSDVLSFSKDYSYSFKRTKIYGKEWYIGYWYSVSMTSDLIKGYFLIDAENKIVYQTNIYNANDCYSAGILHVLHNNKLWVFSDWKHGYFNFETREFVSVNASEFIGLDSGSIVTYLSVADPTEKYITLFDTIGDRRIITFKFLTPFDEELDRLLEGYIPTGRIKYLVILAENPLNFISNTISDIAGKINSKGLKCIWLGKDSNKNTGESIANLTGGSFITFTDYDNAFSQLESWLKSNLPPKNSAYVVEIKKGETISYDKYYFDIEGDSQIPSTIQWYYRHIPGRDGLASFDQTWLDSPVTTFDKDGIYYVSWKVKDNPKPADTDSRFASYRKDSIREEMMLIVGGAEVPQEQVIDPTLELRIGGSLKQNRKVTADLDIVLGTNGIDYSKTVWDIKAVSGGSDDALRVKDISGISKHLLFKQPGIYNVKAVIEDVEGNTFSTNKDLIIVPDQPITGDISIVPGITYRNPEGKAAVTASVNVISPDDFIQYLKYYLIYDSNNDGSYEDESPVELKDRQDLTMFELAAENGVGNYRLLAEAKEGFLEETIPEFVTEEDYSSISLYGDFKVDNLPPLYDIRTEKGIYLVGEDIQYISNISDTSLKGDYTKGYYDVENDPMVSFKAVYTQDKTIMNKQDSTSEYHNAELAYLLTSLDRAGLYTLKASAGDDPKEGDNRFGSFRKGSNNSTSSFIVHRPPDAEALFEAVHPEALYYDFGNHMYLEGTELTITDNSSDPDGFSVSTKLSYKVGNCDYLYINSGDTIVLTYGEPVTVKVDTEDNWGARDVELYTITVVNGLDMIPEVIPSPVPASEEITLRLTTNQYAQNARVEVFGSSLELALVSETAAQKVWETECTVKAERADGNYTARFYASSEGLAELQKHKEFTVHTPIDLVPIIPGIFITGSTFEIKAVTTKYACRTTVVLYKDTVYETVLEMSGSREGGIKNWSMLYTVPDSIEDGDYTAEFTAVTPNGNRESRQVAFSVQSLKISGVTIEGYWNHWRGQVDMFGKRMSDEPHRFLSLERVKINVHTLGFADRVVIRFSPELEAMVYTNELGHTYDYKYDFMGYYVDFPEDSTIVIESPEAVGHIYWEYTLPLAPGTKSWDNIRKREPYSMTVYAYREDMVDTWIINDIDITGNIYDLTYIQPIN